MALMPGARALGVKEGQATGLRCPKTDYIDLTSYGEHHFCPRTTGRYTEFRRLITGDPHVGLISVHLSTTKQPDIRHGPRRSQRAGRHTRTQVDPAWRSIGLF
jgi:hypothetical protein